MNVARLVQTNDDGGVVTYPLLHDGATIYSADRQEALALIEDRCKRRYSIVREGETKGLTYNSGKDSEDVISTRRFWGIEFRCKAE